MKQAKGCINKSCEANKKKIKYKSDDNFCLKCGSSLVPVCKKCHTQLPEDEKNVMCVRCAAEKQDQKDKVVDGAKKAGGAVVAAAGVVVGVAGALVRKK